MAAYCRVYDSHHLQADCQEPGIEYGLPLHLLSISEFNKSHFYSQNLHKATLVQINC